MNRRAFLQKAFGAAAGAAVLTSAVEPAAALIPAAPLPSQEPVRAPAAAVLRDGDLEAAAPEEARWVRVRRRRRAYLYRRPRRVYRLRRRRRYFY